MDKNGKGEELRSGEGEEVPDPVEGLLLALGLAVLEGV
jgi:hypothetical protein